MSTDPADLIPHAIALREAGRAVYGCAIVASRGSTPQRAGALMLVDDGATLRGTIGGGCIEAEVRRAATGMLERGERGRLSFTLDHDYGWDDGLICGGTVDVAVGDLPPLDDLRAIDRALQRGDAAELALQLDDETCAVAIEGRPRLVIAGAGHVGQALARLALPLGFAVTLIDDRGDLLAAATPSGAHAVHGAIESSLRDVDVTDAYCVIVTRGHRHDLDALDAVLARGARYVGMIGSRRKVKLTLDDLADRGADRTELDAVYAPIGLDIGSETVEEIALSIAAQLVAHRRGRDAAGLRWSSSR